MNAMCESCPRKGECLVPKEVREMSEEAVSLFEMGMRWGMVELIKAAVQRRKLKEVKARFESSGS